LLKTLSLPKHALRIENIWREQRKFQQLFDRPRRMVTAFSANLRRVVACSLNVIDTRESSSITCRPGL
jgi:hypothetical protein